jgi:AraC family transcriptional regulator
MPPRDGTESIAAGSVTGNAVRTRPPAATTVLAGAMPNPLLSSRGRGWQGVTVELHRFRDLDTLVRAPDHVIALHLGGAVTVHREHGGQVRSRAMTAGDVTITPVGPPVRWRQVGQSLVLLMRLSPAYIRTIAGDECAIDPDRFEIQPVFSARDPQVEHLGHRLLAGLELEGADSHLYVDTVTCELTIKLLRDYTTVPAAPAWAKAKLSPHKLRRAMQFIDENLRNDLTLTAIADAVALSPGHFAHAFRNATGVAPHRYTVERRVERAKELLRNSDLPLTEIAARIGCATQSHFSVVFHRVTGLTPRQFRSQV